MQIFYLESQATFLWNAKTGIRLETVEIVIQDILWSERHLIKQHEVSLSRILIDILQVELLQWLTDRSYFSPIL